MAKKNGKEIFFRCGKCNFLHLGKVSVCCRCQSNDIKQETFDELPLDQFEIFSDEEKVIGDGGCCSICSKTCKEQGSDFYTIETRSGHGHIYCPEHYIKVKWLMITYGLILLDAEAHIQLTEGRKLL